MRAPHDPPASDAPAALARTLCPLCNGPNACAMEIERTTGVAQGPCWCTTASIGSALLARVPASARHLACICSACVSGDNTRGTTA